MLVERAQAAIVKLAKLSQERSGDNGEDTSEMLAECMKSFQNASANGSLDESLVRMLEAAVDDASDGVMQKAEVNSGNAEKLNEGRQSQNALWNQALSMMREDANPREILSS